MSGKKRQFSKTGLILVGSMVICLIICLAVGMPGGFGLGGNDNNLDDENSPGLKTVMEGSTPILIFDKRKEVTALMTAFDEDQVASVNVKSDVYGNASSSSEEDITDIYKALKNVVILEETTAKCQGGEIVLTFKLGDGSNCVFEFEDDNIYRYSGNNYEISVSEDLISQIKEMCKGE